MTHPVTPAELLLHDAGELDAAEALRVSSHAAGCADCSAQLGELRTLGALFARGASAHPEDLRRQRVLSAIFEGPRRRAGWGVALAAAATLLLILGRAWWPSVRTLPPKAPDPWIARHREVVKRLDGRPVEVARGGNDSGPMIGSAPPDPDLVPMDETRLAVARWEKIAGAQALYPARVPEGMRFKMARLEGTVVEVTFTGGGRSFTVFAGAGSGVERSEGPVMGGTAAGLPFVIVGEGLGAGDLKQIRESLVRPAQK